MSVSAFFGKLFGTEKATERLVESVSSGLDKLVYTNEEKADDAASERAAARQNVIDWISASQGQNIARRVIALSVTFTWLSMYIASLGGSIIAVWTDHPEKWLESVEVIGSKAEGMNAAMMLILAFYFSAPYMGDIAKASLKKFSGKKN
tara:strand:+ start:8073 stop:8519 length:447 start_codon:yes stop_codon:yes gene_type:complete